MKTIHQIADENGNACVVKFDSDYGEYVVEVTKAGQRHEPADYFTGYKNDAVQTAQAIMKEMQETA